MALPPGHVNFQLKHDLFKRLPLEEPVSSGLVSPLLLRVLCRQEQGSKRLKLLLLHYVRKDALLTD